MLATLTGVTPKGNDESQFEALNKLIHIIQDSSEVTDLEAVSGTNFLFGGLNLIYGVDGSGKSWQVSAAIKDSEANNFYIDTDGSNGKLFVDHCLRNNVHYISADTVDEQEEKAIIEKVKKVITLISITMTERKNVIVIDSLTSIAEGLGINNAEDISTPLYSLNTLAAKHGVALILIDHATERPTLPDGFKLEGNAGAKRRTTVTVNKYLPIEKKNVAKGGIFTCERVRGNSSGIVMGHPHIVAAITIEDAVAFMLKKCPAIVTTGITKTEATVTTKHPRDIWVRDFFKDIFNDTLKGATTIRRLKKRYLK